METLHDPLVGQHAALFAYLPCLSSLSVLVSSQLARRWRSLIIGYASRKQGCRVIYLFKHA